MRWRRLFLTLGLLSLVEGRKHYAEILQDPRIEDVFRLLQTRDLLKGNYSGTSDECARDLTVYVGGVESKESWALKMLDASSRVPTGLREGNIIDLGNFDECVESESMRARHCMYAVDPKIEGNILPFHPTMSICLPDSCGSNDVVAMVNGAINATDRLRSFGARLASANCTSNDVPIIDTGVVIWG